MNKTSLTILGCALLWSACDPPSAKLLDGDREASRSRLRRKGAPREQAEPADRQPPPHGGTIGGGSGGAKASAGGAPATPESCRPGDGTPA